MSIDLNSDLGEGAGSDEAIMPHITSANVACGAHAGDDATMRRTVGLAKQHGVAVGAHPGYRDPANFGRVAIQMPAPALMNDIRGQLEALASVAREHGVAVAHVKAHGALYNQAERDMGIATIIAEVVREFDKRLVIFAPPGSAMYLAAQRVGLRIAREGFADRAYEPDGTLRSRKLPNAVHSDPTVAAEQAVSLARDRRVRTSDGGWLPLEVDTICVHGDTPGAPQIVRAVRAALADGGVAVRAVAAP